jgi:hypothetical protein
VDAAAVAAPRCAVVGVGARGGVFAVRVWPAVALANDGHWREGPDWGAARVVNVVRDG